jgi:preprotein translocase subunit SecG
VNKQKSQSGNVQYIAMILIALFFIGALALTYWQNLAIKKAANELIEKSNNRKGIVY